MAAAGVPMADLPARVGSALVMAALALGTAWAGGWSFALLWGAVAVVVLFEWVRMAGHGTPAQAVAAAWAPAFLAASLLLASPGAAGILGAAGGAAWTVVAALALVAVPLTLRATTPEGRPWVLAGIAYAAVLALAPAALRGAPGGGLPAILWLFATVWATDIAAYFGGRFIGGPKLMPSVSPKKTWAGFLSGVFAAMLAGVAIVWVSTPDGRLLGLGGVALAVFTLATAALSQGGDLGESWLKRRFDAKDSGALIPGHGGVMDRVDGFWAAALLAGLVLAARSLA